MADRADYIPTPYKRGLRPSLDASAGPYLEEELRRIEQAFAEIMRALPQVAYREPDGPLEGMIRLAKAPWRPLGTDRAWVEFKDGAWVPL